MGQIPNTNGLFGEILVARELDKLPSHLYFTINDITLQLGNMTTQIDHLVLSQYGLFVVETKAYNGLIKVGDKIWTQHLGNNKYQFTNPYLQNEVHIKFLKKLLNLSNEVFVNIVVFTHDEVKFTKVCTTKLGKLNNQILKHKDVLINLTDIPKYLQLIHDSICPLSLHLERINNSKTQS